MIKIIFEDNHIIVVEKPVNIPVQEDSSKDADLLNILKDNIKKRDGKPGNVYLALLHRLDRPVGGVMVFAKTSKAASRLSEQFRKNEVKKSYLAIINGIPKKSEATLEHYLFKDKNVNIVKVVSRDYQGSKKAILDYQVLATNQNLSLIKVNLQTGRAHQIRVQLSTIGHPLFGDQKYSVKIAKPGEQIALWSNTLGFVHPVKKDFVQFSSTPPDKFPWNVELFKLNF